MFILRKLYAILTFLGIDPLRLFQNITGLRWFWSDYRAFKKLAGPNPLFPIDSFYPLLNDKRASSGSVKGHYFHQDLLVAQRVFNNAPARHVDIGSRIDGFVAHVASYRPVEVFDIRPLYDLIDNVRFTQANLMQVDERLIDYTDSVSCLHTIEHFGLGRYGDPLDPQGYLKGLQAIRQVLRKGGMFYFSTPIGPQRIEFNAHRVFSVAYLLDMFQTDYDLLHFSYVDDKGDLHKHVDLKPTDVQRNFGCRYGCGIFELRKR